jgi:hypothetical protein
LSSGFIKIFSLCPKIDPKKFPPQKENAKNRKIHLTAVKKIKQAADKVCHANHAFVGKTACRNFSDT